MDIIISNGSDKAIYEQITEQIKIMIISGELSEGDSIPPMRALARSLRVSVITVQHAYEILQRDGYIIMNVGRGSYVTKPDIKTIQGENMKKIESLLKEAVNIGKASMIGEKSMLVLLSNLYEDKL